MLSQVALCVQYRVRIHDVLSNILETRSTSLTQLLQHLKELEEPLAVAAPPLHRDEAIPSYLRNN